MCTRVGWSCILPAWWELDSTLFLLNEKPKSLNVFKSFKVVVELKLGKKIKCVNFNKCDQYYGKYDETERNLSPFAKHLQECGIEANYIMLRTSKQNNIIEKKN